MKATWQFTTKYSTSINPHTKLPSISLSFISHCFRHSMDSQTPQSFCVPHLPISALPYSSPPLPSSFPFLTFHSYHHNPSSSSSSYPPDIIMGIETWLTLNIDSAKLSPLYHDCYTQRLGWPTSSRQIKFETLEYFFSCYFQQQDDGGVWQGGSHP